MDKNRVLAGSHADKTLSAASTLQDTELPKPHEEIDYIGQLNRTLPANVRVTGWAPVPDSFSARYSTAYRVYRYYFNRRGVDIEVRSRGFCYPVSGPNRLDT